MVNILFFILNFMFVIFVTHLRLRSYNYTVIHAVIECIFVYSDIEHKVDLKWDGLERGTNVQFNNIIPECE